MIIVSVILSFSITSFYQEHTELETTTLDLLSQAKGPYLIIDPPNPTSYVKAYYSYAAIYFNLTTPSGWSTSELSENLNNLLKKTTDEFKNNDCAGFISDSKELGLKSIIAYNEFCSVAEKCNLREKTEKNNVCLIEI